MPDLAKRFAVRFPGGLDLDLLEAVFAAMIACVSARDSLCSLLRDLRQVNFQAASEARLVQACLRQIFRRDSLRALQALSVRR